MHKVLVEIYCSATMKNYDFWLPKKMPVKTAIEKIEEDIMTYELNEELFDSARPAALFCYENRMFLDQEHTIEENGITSGNRLMIV